MVRKGRQESLPLNLQTGLVQARRVAGRDLGQRSASFGAIFTGDEHQPPGRDLAVIRHPHGDSQHLFKLIGTKFGRLQKGDADRTAGPADNRATRESPQLCDTAFPHSADISAQQFNSCRLIENRCVCDRILPYYLPWS